MSFEDLQRLQSFISDTLSSVNCRLVHDGQGQRGLEVVPSLRLDLKQPELIIKHQTVLIVLGNPTSNVYVFSNEREVIRRLSINIELGDHLLVQEVILNHILQSDKFVDSDDDPKEEDTKVPVPKIKDKVTKGKSKRARDRSRKRTENCTCHLCGKVMRKASLSQHLRYVHDGENQRKYPCSQCDLTFKTPHTLAKHSFVHSGTDCLGSICDKRINVLLSCFRWTTILLLLLRKDFQGKFGSIVNPESSFQFSFDRAMILGWTVNDVAEAISDISANSVIKSSIANSDSSFISGHTPETNHSNVQDAHISAVERITCKVTARKFISWVWKNVLVKLCDCCFMRWSIHLKIITLSKVTGSSLSSSSFGAFAAKAKGGRLTKRAHSVAQ